MEGGGESGGREKYVKSIPQKLKERKRCEKLATKVERHGIFLNSNLSHRNFTMKKTGGITETK